MMKLPRSIYAAKLLDFPDFAFADQAIFDRRGRWSDFFRQRIGPAFDGRVIVEIGCSDVAFLSVITAKYPHTGFIGLDWKCKALYDGAQRIAALGQRNVALLRGRGQDVLKIFGEGEIDEVWVFHPDPCDRDVELKNRLIAEPFLTDLHAVLRDGTSSLCLKTDHPGYYQWVLALFGIAEPNWFQSARETADSPPQKITSPRVRVSDLMRREDIPKPNEAIQRRFAVTINSADYWHDPDALTRTIGRCFSGEITLYESRFIKKRLPIYYIEMRKNPPENPAVPAI